MMTVKQLLACAAAGALACSALAQNSQPDTTTKTTEKTTTTKEKTEEKKVEHKETKTDGVAPGAMAPAFTVKDTDGKEHTLAAATKAGKVVVLQWFNAECPYVVKHYNETKTFNDLHAKYASKGVEFFAVNSGAPGKGGTGKALNAKMKKDWAIPYPILLDESGTVGKAYGAKNTPAMVVIGKDGKVAYMGAIDDDNKADKPGKTNYVAKALDEVLAGTTVTTPSTKPYGCGVKY